MLKIALKKKLVWKKNRQKHTPVQLAALTAMKISVLLKSGMNMKRAIEHAAEQKSAASEILVRVQNKQQAGLSLAEAFGQENDPAWRVFAASLEVARKSGAPMAHACEKLSEAFLKVDQLTKRRDILLAGPKGTVILIAVLPILTIFLSNLLGIDMFAQLLSRRGMLLLFVGVSLLVLGVLWATIMVRDVANKDTVAGLELDFMWIALAGGQNPRNASRLVADSIDRMRAEWIPLNNLCDDSDLARVLKTAEKTGSPVRPLLASEANRLRETKNAALSKDAETLAIKILLPLGLLILPSFITLGVIPLLIALMG